MGIVDILQDADFPPPLPQCFEAGLLAMVMLSWLAIAIPRLRPETQPANRHICIDDLDEITFRQRFRFQCAHVREMMAEFGLLMANGEPWLLRVGRPQHTSAILADAAFLTMLCKLSYLCLY